MKHNIIVIIPLLFMSAVSEKVIDLSRVCDGFDEGFAKCVFAGPGTYVNTRVSREVRRLKIDSLRNSQISTVNLPNLEWIEIDNPQFDNKAACEHIAVPFWRTIRVEFKDVIHRCTPMSASSSEKTRPDVITSQTTTAQETTEDSSLRHQMTERSTVMTSQTTTSLETTDHSSSRHQMTEPTTIQPVTPEPTTTKLHSNDGTTQDNGKTKTFSLSLTSTDMPSQGNTVVNKKASINIYIAVIVLLLILNACLLIVLIVICLLRYKQKNNKKHLQTNSQEMLQTNLLRSHRDNISTSSVDTYLEPASLQQDDRIYDDVV